LDSSREFAGYHSEWNLGSPGGWDYQRITQVVGKSVWRTLQRKCALDIDLDFDHPFMHPVDGFADMLIAAHRERQGTNPGLIAVVAEEETLDDVVENKNLAKRLDAVPGLSSDLMAPQELELQSSAVCWHGRPVSVVFMDFNTDVLLDLHRKHGLSPLVQAVREGRVINPRGTEPINTKSMFEVLTDARTRSRFERGTVERTPWTRRFFPRRTEGPAGEVIADLIAWTRANWDRLVLKPDRGYSGKGVRVGTVHPDVDETIELALDQGDYIVQEKIPLDQWAEELPELDVTNRRVAAARYQTDFRCLFGGEGLFGFVGRYGGVPTNVGSGGGVQPLAVLREAMPVREATARVNEAIGGMAFEDVADAVAQQQRLSTEHQFTYLLGPIKMALRPRLITLGQIEALESYCRHIWSDALIMEKMWLSGELDALVNIEPEELEIARSQPWGGTPAILASDGLFNFGACAE